MTTSEWSHDAQVALDLQRLHELRQAIQADFTEAADRQPFPDAEWLILRTAVTEAIENARLVTAHNQTRLEWPGEDLADIGHAVAVSAHELLTGPELPRVKHCAGCHWLFLDESKMAAAAGAAWPTAAPTPKCGATSPATPPNGNRQLAT